MRLAFLGTPDAAVPPLRALVAAGHDVAIVVSRPDRRRGRGQAIVPSPVKAAAVELGLRVGTRPEEVVEAGAELGVVVAFGAIIKEMVLDQVPMVNLHFSLLPRWRGAAPVERAILAGDAMTGVCLMVLDEGLDTGPVYARREVEIGDEESADELRLRLVELGTELLVERLRLGRESLGIPESQEGEAIYASKVSREDLRLDWDRPAAELARVVRCGRAWTTVDGRRLLVLRARVASSTAMSVHDPPAPAATPAPAPAAMPQVLEKSLPGRLQGTLVVTASGALELLEVGPEGRARMSAADWLRGARLGEFPTLGT